MVVPVIEPGVPGIEFIFTNVLLAELVPQVLPAVTVTLPADTPAVIVIEVVP